MISIIIFMFFTITDKSISSLTFPAFFFRTRKINLTISPLLHSHQRWSLWSCTLKCLGCSCSVFDNLTWDLSLCRPPVSRRTLGFPEFMSTDDDDLLAPPVMMMHDDDVLLFSASNLKDLFCLKEKVSLFHQIFLLLCFSSLLFFAHTLDSFILENIKCFIFCLHLHDHLSVISPSFLHFLYILLRFSCQPNKNH